MPRRADPPTPFGRRVRTARERAHLKQIDLAAIIGGNVTDSIISQAEMTRTPSLLWPALIDGIAAALDLDRDELYAMANKPPPELVAAITGNLPNIRKVRKALQS